MSLKTLLFNLKSEHNQKLCMYAIINFPSMNKTNSFGTKEKGKQSDSKYFYRQ